MRKKIKKIGALLVLGMFLLLMSFPQGIAPPGPDWNTQGNSAGSTDFLGTTNREDLRFKTNNTQRMVIDTDGNVGIGTPSPGNKLTVQQDRGEAAIWGDGQIRIQGDTDPGKFLQLRLDTVNNFGEIQVGHQIGPPIHYNLALNPSGGNVGVGLVTPSHVLEVKGRGVVQGATFTGSGLNDMYSGGNCTADTDLNYKVEINTTGTPDTFKWSDDGGSTWDETEVNITGSAQTLNHSVTVTFGATTGHTLGDYWTFSTDVTNPFGVQDAAGNSVFYVGNDGRIGLGTSNPDPEYDFEVHADQIWFNASIIKFGNSSFNEKPHWDSLMSTRNYRIIFDDQNSPNDYYFAVGVHEDFTQDTPAYETSERFWIRENGSTGVGAKYVLGRFWVHSTPYIGSGNISSSGTTVTGTGTSFTTDMMIGSEIWIDIENKPKKPKDDQRQIRRVTAINSDTSLEIHAAFDPDLSNTGYNYTRPIFSVDINENVGISTISPTEKLDVNGKARIRVLPPGGTLDNVVVADSNGVLHIRDESTIGIQNLWETIYSNDTSTSTIANSPTDTLYFEGHGIATVSISGDTVNITATEVDGDTTNELQNLAEVYAHDEATGNAVQLTETNGDIRFYNDDSTEMLLLNESTGNIGIGMLTPNEKLDVIGNVHASGSFIAGSTTTYGDGSITTSGSTTSLTIGDGATETLFIDTASKQVGICTDTFWASKNILEIDTGNDWKNLALISDSPSDRYSQIVFYAESQDWIGDNKAYGWGIGHFRNGYFSGDTSGTTLEFFCDATWANLYCPLAFKANGDVVLASPRNTDRTGNVGIGTTDFGTYDRLTVKSEGSAAYYYGLKVQNSAGTNQFVVRSDGNVGIGITNPSTTLHVDGDVAFDQGDTTLEVDDDGYITVTHTYHLVDDADQDDELVSIWGGDVAGQILIIRAANSDRTVTVKDTGNLRLSGDFTMDHARDTLTLMYDGISWLEISRSNNDT